MAVERRGWVIAVDLGQPVAGKSPSFNGRRQPSRDDTSRMMREYQVRICERLGVKFPGPTRQPLTKFGAGADGQATPGISAAADYDCKGPRHAPYVPPADIDVN